jgi:hypothetical protein
MIDNKEMQAEDCTKNPQKIKKKRALTDKDRARIKAWQQQNKAKLREYSRRYRAKGSSGSTGVPVADELPVIDELPTDLINEFGDEIASLIKNEMDWGLSKEEATNKVLNQRQEEFNKTRVAIKPMEECNQRKLDNHNGYQSTNE